MQAKFTPKTKQFFHGLSKYLKLQHRNIAPFKINPVSLIVKTQIPVRSFHS